MTLPRLDQYLLSQFLEMENLGELSENSVHTLNQLIQKYDLRLYINLSSRENSFCLTSKGDSEQIVKVKNNPVYIRSMRYSKPWLAKPRLNINVLYEPSRLNESSRLLFPFKWVEFPYMDPRTQMTERPKHFGPVSISRFSTEIFISNEDYKRYKNNQEDKSIAPLPKPEKKKITRQDQRINCLEKYLMRLGLDLSYAPFSKEDHLLGSRAHAWKVLNEEFPEIFGVVGKATIDSFFDNQRLIKFKENKGALKK